MSSDVIIRPARVEDLPALHVINEASVPNVGTVTFDELAALLDQTRLALTAERDGAPVGFLFAIGPGSIYASPNYRWFVDRAGKTGGDFLYVDRIAIAEPERGNGLGAALYEAAIAAAPAGCPVCCEVNTAPPNPGSLRFHKRIGFIEVGAAAYVPGEKEVAFLERPSPQG